MREIKGQRPGTKRWEHEHHHYHQDSSAPTRYRCTFHSTEWKCLAEVHGHQDGTFEVSGTHYHPPPIDHEDKQILIAALKQRAMETEEPTGTVVDQVFRQYREISGLMQRETAMKCVRRERDYWRNRIPNTLAELQVFCKNYIPAQAIFRDQVMDADGEPIVIFANSNVFERLNNIDALHVDGTFKTVPDHPRPAQLFIISMRKLDIGIPAIFILTARRTGRTYIRIWEYLLEKAPDLPVNLRSMVSDFEPAILSSIADKMPWVTVTGCWFHFIQAVSRKWRSCGLAQGPNEILRLVWALPLAPANRFEEGLNTIEIQARLFLIDQPNLRVFLQYLRTYWLPRATIVSVRQSPVRTNNLAEAFNRRIVSHLGRYPPLPKFIAKLKFIIDDVEAKWVNMSAGTFQDRDRRARQVNDDLHILEQQERLDENRCTMLQFLQTAMVDRVIQDIHIHIARPEMDGENNPENDGDPHQEA